MKTKEQLIKKRKRNFLLNLIVTIVSIILVLLLMFSSTFLTNVLSGNKKIVFYGIILFGLLFWLSYVIVYRLFPLEEKEEFYLSVAGTKYEKEFYDFYENEDIKELEDNPSIDNQSIEENVLEENVLEEQSQIEISQGEITQIEQNEQVNGEPEVLENENKSKSKKEKYHLSIMGKVMLVYENIADLYTVVCVAFLIVAFMFCYILFPATVQGECMQPLLYGQTFAREGDKIIAIKNKKFDIGDVVVFAYDYTIQSSNSSVQDGELLIKRVVAGPGQHFECIDGVLYIDGLPLEEDYVQYPYVTSVNYTLDSIIKHNENFSEMGYQGGSVIPEGYYVLLGDNRNVANDSHYFGLVSEDQICGVVVVYKNNEGWHKINEVK